MTLGRTSAAAPRGQMDAIAVRGLTRRYGPLLAVDHTTHNLEEANQLRDRVTIIHRGRIAAIDTPQALRRAIESRRCVEVVFAEAPGAAPPVSDPAAPFEVIAAGAGVRVYTRTPGATAQEIATWATGRGLHIEGISTRGRSLEDVFLSLTASVSTPSETPVHART